MEPGSLVFMVRHHTEAPVDNTRDKADQTQTFTFQESLAPQNSDTSFTSVTLAQ